MCTMTQHTDTHTHADTHTHTHIPVYITDSAWQRNHLGRVRQTTFPRCRFVAKSKINILLASNNYRTRLILQAPSVKDSLLSQWTINYVFSCFEQRCRTAEDLYAVVKIMLTREVKPQSDLKWKASLSPFFFTNFHSRVVSFTSSTEHGKSIRQIKNACQIYIYKYCLTSKY